MGGTDTTYRIQVLYEAKDKASAPLGAVAEASGRAARSTNMLGSALGAVGAALAGFASLRAAKSAFVDFNSTIEQSNISLAAQEMLLKGGSWDGAMKNATALFADYQQVAKASVGETKDFLEMHRMIASSAYQAGMSMKQLKEMTIGATVASAAFGERADVVALDVKQMLAGTVGARDRFAQMMLASQHIDEKTFNQSSAGKRAKITMAALNSPAFKEAAKAMETSFAGVTSTLKDNLQIALARVGLPLFKAITAEIAHWNTWIDKHPDQIRQWAADFSNALTEGFEMVKGIAGFLVDNKDLLMSLAKAWLAGKATGGLANGLMGMARGGIGGTAGGLGMVASGASIVADLVDHEQDLKIAAETKWSTAQRGMEEYDRAKHGRFKGRDEKYAETAGYAAARERIDRRFLTNAKAEGFLVGGKVNRGAIEAAAPEGFSTAEQDKYVAILEKLNTAERRLSMERERSTDIALHAGQAFLWWSQNMGGFVDLMSALTKSRQAADKAFHDIVDKKPVVNVNIAMTDDPDRFAVDFDGIALDAVKNPRGSVHVWRE